MKMPLELFSERSISLTDHSVYPVCVMCSKILLIKNTFPGMEICNKDCTIHIHMDIFDAMRSRAMH